MNSMNLGSPLKSSKSFVSDFFHVIVPQQLPAPIAKGIDHDLLNRWIANPPAPRIMAVFGPADAEAHAPADAKAALGVTDLAKAGEIAGCEIGVDGQTKVSQAG